MFFLPLPLNKTLQTMDEVEGGKMPDCPELYIIINGKPTAKKKKKKKKMSGTA